MYPNAVWRIDLSRQVLQNMENNSESIAGVKPTAVGVIDFGSEDGEKHGWAQIYVYFRYV